MNDNRLTQGQTWLILNAVEFNLLHADEMSPAELRSAASLVTRGIFSFDNADGIYDLTSAAHSKWGKRAVDGTPT